MNCRQSNDVGATIPLLLALIPLLLACRPAAAQQFVNVASSAGFGSTTTTNGVAVADYDGDGDLDVYFVAKESYSTTDASTWNRLFRNNGHGSFTAVTNSTVLRGLNTDVGFNGMGYKMGASWGDYDNDGKPDLYLTNLGPNILLHNDGNGFFTDVTTDAGVAGGGAQLSSSALWVDLDADGDLDLYVSVWQDLSASTPDRSNRLYRNEGDGTFTDISTASGANDSGATWTTVAIDANSDGRLDLYLATDFGANKLYVNNGDETFTEATAAYGVEDNFHGMGLAVADCDANGFLDVYVTNITEFNFDVEKNPLFLNTGGNSFINTAATSGVDLAGWGWGTEFFDMDSDGDEDLFVGTGYFTPDFRNVLFENLSESGFAFENVAPAAGVDDLAPARGIAIADFDEDGDMDLLVSNVTDEPALYENETAQGHWLKVRLEGTTSNVNGVGALLEFQTGEKTQIRYAHGAQYLAQNLIPVHVGLGLAEAVDRVVVRWPGGAIDEVFDLNVNQTIEIREGEGLVSGTHATDVEVARPLAVASTLTTFPNPFTESVWIRIETTTADPVQLEVFDAIGRLVSRELIRLTAAGTQRLQWRPAFLKQGLYHVRVTSADGRRTLGSGTAIHIRP